LGKIWFPSRSWSCELIIVIVFGMGSHGVGWSPLLLCNGNSSYYYYSSSSSSPKPICPIKFSETDDPTFTKLHRKVDPHLKRCIQVLEFSKWLPLPWKPWTYVKIFDLTLYRKPPKGFPQDMAYILSRVGRIFWPKKIASKWLPFWKWPPTKSAKFQSSLISMKIDI
jgi:hypothetical protein